MSKDLNNATLVGRLVRDPETKYLASGTPVCNFSIANNDVYMSNNEKKETVSFFDITAFGNLGVICEKYLKKGSQVSLTGRLKQERWEDKTDGKARSKIIITANEVHFLSKSENSTNNITPLATNAPQVTTNTDCQTNDPWKEDDTTPF